MSKQQQKKAIPRREIVQNREEISYLTPDLFQKLDTLARIEAGRPLSVRWHQDMKSFAEVSGWAEEQFDITGEKPVQMRETGCINLANLIELRNVRACKRPEMDWSVLNTENVYQFIILHEIAHVRRGDPMFFFDMQRRADYLTCGTGNGWGREVSPKYKGLVAAMEADADRAAWAALCPGEPMPKRPDMAIPPDVLDEMMEKFKGEREKYRCRSIKPISTDPRMHVPWNHVKDGPPFASKVDLIGTHLNQISGRRMSAAESLGILVKVGHRFRFKLDR